MDTSPQLHNTFIDLSKLDIDELQVLRDFYYTLLDKRKDKKNKNQDLEKLPDVFYQATKVKRYQAFKREEVYGEK
jgi:hypothetical protein